MAHTATVFHTWKKSGQALACFGIILLLGVFFTSPAFGLRAGEYEIKSAYLEKITRFIKWPDHGTATGGKSSFVIGMAGDNPFYGVLQEDYRSREIKGKPVRIVKIASVEAIKNCDLLFISSSEDDRLERYIRTAERYHVLTVGDTAGFAERGVHVNFYVERQKVLFEINPAAMKRAALSAASLLLDYATIVKPDP
ncbi:MAG: YfiR family protein [Desulfobacterales bacterium]|nr:YfiR family protein [Desulfobacterales bacterium]